MVSVGRLQLANDIDFSNWLSLTESRGTTNWEIGAIIQLSIGDNLRENPKHANIFMRGK
jgi:hypothetical protein